MISRYCKYECRKYEIVVFQSFVTKCKHLYSENFFKDLKAEKQENDFI